ncbi:MAG: hypothetical protein Q7I91_05195, partial [Moraxellaceae bacterium]|nr:hypothetical protein [Moraxellaceae bacterium]
MRKKLIGDYGLLETGLALLAFTLLCYLNTKFFYGVYEGWIVTEQAILILVFMNLIGLVIVALPYLTKKAEGISNDDLKVFLDLPDKDSKITFTLVSGFL